MKLKNKIAGFRNYLDISKKLAEVKNKSRAKVLLKMIWSRLLLSISPAYFRPYFVRYGFTEKSISQDLLRRIQDYLSISKFLAIGPNRTRFKVLLKMLFCKFAYGHEALMFATYGLEEKSIPECSEYLSKKKLTGLQKKINTPPFTRLAYDKLSFYKRCKSSNIKTPDIFAVVSIDELRRDSDIPILRNSESLSAFLAHCDEKLLFFKVINGTYGDGVLSLGLKNGNIYNHIGEKLSGEAIFSHCCTYRDGFLIQEHLSPHRALRSLMQGPGLGTFRLNTVLRNNKQDVSIPYAFVRVPVQGQIIDNFQHGKSGNLVCAIDVESGKLFHGWGKRKDEFKISPIKLHPDTKIEFTNITVPFWKDIIALVTRAAKAFSELPTLGWDIAITEKGLYIVEANCWYDPDLPQFTLNRGIKAEILQLYDSISS